MYIIENLSYEILDKQSSISENYEILTKEDLDKYDIKIDESKYSAKLKDVTYSFKFNDCYYRRKFKEISLYSFDPINNAIKFKVTDLAGDYKDLYLSYFIVQLGYSMVYNVNNITHSDLTEIKKEAKVFTDLYMQHSLKTNLDSYKSVLDYYKKYMEEYKSIIDYRYNKTKNLNDGIEENLKKIKRR